MKIGSTGLMATNRIFRVILTSKRVYQTSSILRTTALNADFDIERLFLRSTAETPVGTSVTWSFSVDGGETWKPIAIDEPLALSQPTRTVLLEAVLNGTETATPCIDSYSLDVSAYDEGLRFTGKEMDVGTGLVYFGARYYDPEVGRWTTVDPAGEGLNWYVYCRNNPLKFMLGIPLVQGTFMPPVA